MSKKNNFKISNFINATLFYYHLNFQQRKNEVFFYQKNIFKKNHFLTSFLYLFESS